MSVGGLVEEIIDVPAHGRVWINTREPGTGDLCAIYVERSPATRSITEGDSLWWQGGKAFWTPATRAFSDYAVKRIGCSGISRAAVLQLKNG